MAIRVISTRTDTIGDVELVEEQELVSTNEELKTILLSWGWVKPYDDTLPLPPKGLGIYETKVYPVDRFATKDGNLYQSNTETSATWVSGEWNIIITGL
jgi:hypothetical protein